MEGLRELTLAVDRLSIPLRVIVFFLMTVGFILKVRRIEFAAEAILPIIASSVIILGFIVSQDWWFKQTQEVFFTIAHQIKADYETNPYESIQALKEAKQEQERNEGFGHLIKNIKASLLEAFLNSFMYILIALASGIQVIFVCVYSILIEVFRLLFPLALACYQFDSLRSLGFNFVSKALSVMSWPVGFSLIERIAQALQAHFYHSHSAFDTLHGGIFFPVLVSILVIGGTLITPSLMSSLFTAGDIGSSATGFARTAISAMQGVRGMATRSLVGLSPLSRAGGSGVQRLAKMGAAALPHMSQHITSGSSKYSSTNKSLNDELSPYSNTQKTLFNEAPQAKFTEAANRTASADVLNIAKPLPERAVSQNFQSFEKQGSFSTKKAASSNIPKTLHERKVSQEHSKIAAHSNVNKNDENGKLSAPPHNGFNTPTKKPRGAATLNSAIYTIKANQIAESVDKNNTLLFL